jgi:hypothetical protein
VNSTSIAAAPKAAHRHPACLRLSLTLVLLADVPIAGSALSRRWRSLALQNGDRHG